MSGARSCVAAVWIALLLCSRAHAAGPDADAAREASALARGFSRAVQAIGPAVVRIEIGLAGKGSSAVSGVIIDTLGHVVTSAAAVAHADSLAIATEGGRSLPAYLRGLDMRSGIAVLGLEGRPPSDLQAARFADSDLVEIGDWVLAVGRQEDATEAVSTGIISGRSHPANASPVSAILGTGAGAGGALVIDAAIDATKVGGAIVRLDGEVIAIAAFEGGIPINQVRRVAQMIIADGETQYPYIGVMLTDVQDLAPGERARLGSGSPWRGALVSRILSGAPAARAGLRPGDVITTVDNLETRAANEVVDRVSYHAVGESLTLGFVRDGRERSAQVSVAALPPVVLSPVGDGSSRDSTSWVISAGAPSRIGGPQ